MRDSTSYADPGLKMWDTFALATDLRLQSPTRTALGIAMHSQSNLKSPPTLATANYLTQFRISIALLEHVLPDAGLQKRTTFSTLNVGLAGTGNQTRATCVAGSVAKRSANHYVSIHFSHLSNAFFPVPFHPTLCCIPSCCSYLILSSLQSSWSFVHIS
jgi:hypothetical protein